LHQFIDRHQLNCRLEVDGGVNRATAPELIAAGVDVLVMGSAFFGEKERAKLIRDIKSVNE
jgi:ribulose-phosphate 3-epimerase